MSTELGEFLRTRRAAITPDEAGVTSYGARRVPGLRREELAQLAGVSPTYYTRLEQSDHHNASDSVIDALAHALRLSPEEHAHLRRLARPEVASPRQRYDERPRATALGLIAGATGPALLVDHCNDVVAWNPQAHRLLGFDLPFDAPERADNRPNFTKMFFLDPAGPDVYADPDGMARAFVGFLHYSSGLYPDDHRLSCLVGELTQRSDWFARLWLDHPVMDCGYGVKRFRHPLVGRIDLDYEAMLVPDSTLRMVLYHAEPGSPAADALELLEHA